MQEDLMPIIDFFLLDASNKIIQMPKNRVTLVHNVHSTIGTLHLIHKLCIVLYVCILDTHTHIQSAV